MSFMPGWYPGGGMVTERPAETTYAGSIADFANGQTKTIPCTFGPVHSTRHAYCVINTGRNANDSVTGNITDVTIDGNACTQLFLTQSGAFHASAWGCALPSGVSGNCVVRRLVGNGLSTIRASVFTVNYLKNPLALIDKTDFVNDAAADPFSGTIQTTKRGCILFSVAGPGPNSGSQVTTSTTGLVLDAHIFGASPNTSEICSAHYDDTPTDAAFPFAFDALGAGSTQPASISLR